MRQDEGGAMIDKIAPEDNVGVKTLNTRENPYGFTSAGKLRLPEAFGR